VPRGQPVKASFDIHSIIMYIGRVDQNVMLFEEPCIVAKEPVYV
jgi:hypothetical protein